MIRLPLTSLDLLGAGLRRRTHRLGRVWQAGRQWAGRLWAQGAAQLRADLASLARPAHRVGAALRLEASAWLAVAQALVHEGLGQLQAERDALAEVCRWWLAQSPTWRRVVDGVRPWRARLADWADRAHAQLQRWAEPGWPVLALMVYVSMTFALLMVLAFSAQASAKAHETLSRRKSLLLAGDWRTPTATPSPTATLTPSPTPTATPTPPPTATPILWPYREWESSLPPYGGWNGLGQCPGAVLAPVGGGVFIWPTDKHYLVGKDFSWRWHPGLDLGGDYGDVVYAADSGVVVYAGWNTYGYGNLVILDHGNGWHTLYAHFNEVSITCGAAVMQGQILGMAGSTGYSTGPHVHFEMSLNGSYVIPWDYLP